MRIFFLLIKKHYRELMEDLKMYSLVNEASCVIDLYPIRNEPSREDVIVNDIRKLAMENYNEDIDLKMEK